jgi:uncharacterized protein YecT (DUF1311 family)
VKTPLRRKWLTLRLKTCSSYSSFPEKGPGKERHVKSIILKKISNRKLKFQNFKTLQRIYRKLPAIQ